MRQRGRVLMIEIALSEVIRDFVERALLPFLGLSQPEDPAHRIKCGTLATNLLLTAYLDEPVHEASTPGVKSNDARSLAEMPWRCLTPHGPTQQHSVITP
jgi:hypothetical protein